jgi:hypothetical protein
MKLLMMAAFLAIDIAGCATQHRDHIASLDKPNPHWREECGGCHDLYPPMMLAASNWDVMMQQLARHFGVDASLPEATRKNIALFLVEHGAPDHSSSHASTSLRITQTPYFLSVHGGSSIPIWLTTDQDKKASNCSACHRSNDDQLW